MTAASRRDVGLRLTMIFPRVILVTDPAFGDDRIVRCVQLVAGALPPRWLCVQLRDKSRPRDSLRAFARRLRDVTRDCGAAFVVNGDAQLALDVEADGVHLGRKAGTPSEARGICGPQAWVSVAAHSDDAVRVGADGGADAVLVSPVFPTRSPSFETVPPKAPRGLEALRSARDVAGGRVGIYALGGISPENARSCVDAGADGVATLRALLAGDEPGRVARALHDALAARC